MHIDLGYKTTSAFCWRTDDAKKYSNILLLPRVAIFGFGKTGTITEENSIFSVSVLQYTTSFVFVLQICKTVLSQYYNTVVSEFQNIIAYVL